MVKVHAMRIILARLGWLWAVALLATGCQRTFVTINTPEGNVLGPSATPDRNAIVESVRGTVEWRASANAEWAAAQQGQVLSQGAEVRTGSESRATLRLTEGSKIYVGAGTEVVFNQLNPYLDSQLTELDLGRGQLWVLLNGGALDVKTPIGTATARTAYLSLDYQPQGQNLDITCLQGVCGFGTVLIPSGEKLADAQSNTATVPMSLADFGVWGQTVPEATQLAIYATEAVAQGSATFPIVSTATPSDTPEPTETRPASATPVPTDTAPPAPTGTPVPDQPTATETPTPIPPSLTPIPPTDTPAVIAPSATPRPFTPVPRAPIIGQHVVQGGETVFCIGRTYGVLPGAIGEANRLNNTLIIFPGQRLDIPQVRWPTILPGPVCAPQFVSPFPGLPMPTATSAATATQSGPPLSLSYTSACVDNCGTSEGSYVIHFELSASGGIPPYSFSPAQSFDVTVAHCVTGTGTISVRSADGQFVSQSWSFVDVSCPTP